MVTEYIFHDSILVVLSVLELGAQQIPTFTLSESCKKHQKFRRVSIRNVRLVKYLKQPGVVACIPPRTEQGLCRSL